MKKLAYFLALLIGCSATPEYHHDTLGDEPIGTRQTMIVGRTGPAPTPITPIKPTILPDGGIFDESEDFVWVCPDAGKK